ncbi:MAG: DHH family phosphoesterase [Candidatus Aminicenantes bacterium]|nr:DHH family phosphoesterase [Candidatus Aminicenantes bacterium]
MTRNPTEDISRALRRCRRVAITSHLRPDGDSICTGLALRSMILRLGGRAEVINTDPTPFPFHAFPDAQRIRTGQIPPNGFDAVILLECADVSRSGQKHVEGYFKINIDHHYTNDRYADINWVEPEAPAVGEMAFRLGERLGMGFTRRMAEHLYCAIVSDTGSFQFSNTNGPAFDACARLVRLGVQPIRVSERLFNNNSPEKIRLLGRVLTTLRLNAAGNLAAVTLFLKDLRNCGLREVDTEDITTLVRSIKDIEIVLFFKQMKRETFRVSLRSKGRIHAARLAEHFGGGGHVHAAGFTVQGRYERLIRDIPARLEKLLGRSRER